MKIKLSQFTPEEIIERRIIITTKGRNLITKDKGNLEEIYPVLDATHVMRRDTTPEIVPETKAPPTRSQTRKDIMFTQLKMMNQQRKDSEKKKLIVQVIKNMS